MIKKTWTPQDQTFWYLKRDKIIPCNQDVHGDVIIIGGGMAGLSAAQAWHKRGKKVILLEQYYCGAGATGKSSGFITPNAELSFTDFSNKYNPDTAYKIWNFISNGVENIRQNITINNFDCGYSKQNTIILANNLHDMKKLELEHKNIGTYEYKTRLYDAQSIQKQVSSKAYVGGIEYEDTFGIDGYLYCQSMKQHLQDLGVLLFEETPVTEIKGHTVITPYAKITGDNIVVCTDRFMPQLNILTQEVYHAQTFVMASQVLSDEQIQAIFPDKKLMAWDTDLVYTYFRVTKDNRLVIGGGDFATSYALQEMHNYAPIVKKLTDYIATKFPKLNVQFQQVWPGLIGISKDIVPLAGPDKDKPYIYYVSAAAGLPIADALGRYSAEHLIDGVTTFDEYFSPYRKFPISGMLQSILGNKRSFMISNIIKSNIP